LEFSEDIRDFMDSLEEAGHLIQVDEEVDPILEINAILDHLARSSGPAVHFQNVKGYKTSVLGNVFGNWQRIGWAFGVDDFAAQAEKKMKEAFNPPDGKIDPKTEKEVRESFLYSKIADNVLMMKGFLDGLPIEIKDAPCKEQFYSDDQIDINMFPLVKLWPQDGERFITMPLVITRDPETGDLNVGTYRMMYLDKNKTCMHWLPKKHGNSHFQKAERLGVDLPVAVVIGCDPALQLAGCFSLRPPIDEFIMAGKLKGDRIRVVKAELSDLPIPAGAEVVLEGVVRPGVRAMEGPFGEFHGYYSPPKETPVFEIQLITTRHHPYWQVATTGKPVTEIHLMAKSMERLSVAMLKSLNSDIIDMNMASEGGTLYLMIVSIKKNRPYHARDIIDRIWEGKGQSTFISNIIVVDEDINVHDLSEVMWAYSLNVRPDKDLVISEKMQMDLEHPGLSPRGVGTRMAVDATKKWKEEDYEREHPALVEMDPKVMEHVIKNWSKYGLEKPSYYARQREIEKGKLSYTPAIRHPRSIF